MTRLVAAILILFAVLIGLKAANSSLFQNNLLGQTSSATPATRNTGFSSEVTGTTANGSVPSTGLNTLNQVNTSNQLNTAATTPLPPGGSPAAAVRAGW